MKITVYILLSALLICSCRSAKVASPAYTSPDRESYIRKYSDLAIQEMRRSGIPASIKMAQALLESDNGNSTLARQANNHFGIKCHKDWKGKRILHHDDDRNECFRKYDQVYESYRDHTDFLLGGSRYAFLFDIPADDYRSWARGLKKAGYATNPHYAEMLIRIIDDNRLYTLDKGQVVANPSMTAAARASGSERQSGKPVQNQSEFSVNLPGRKVNQLNRINFIVVKEGDSFFSVAKEMDLMVWELYRYNDLPRNAVPRIGQELFIQPKRNRAAPGYEYHELKKDETMYSVSQKYGIKLSRLYKMNLLEEGEEPGAGTVLQLRRTKTGNGT